MLVYPNQIVGYPVVTLDTLEQDALDLLFDDFDMEFIHVEAEQEQE